MISRIGSKELLERVRSLHVSEFTHSWGVGEGRGYPGMIQWFDSTGEVIREFRFTVKVGAKDRAKVRLAHWGAGVEGEEIEEINLSGTQANYGGIRWWLVCSLCGRRRIRLYYRSQQFGCRLCLGLAYETQRLDAVGRAAERVGRLNRKIQKARRRVKRFGLMVEREKSLMALDELLQRSRNVTC